MSFLEKIDTPEKTTNLIHVKFGSADRDGEDKVHLLLSFLLTEFVGAEEIHVVGKDGLMFVVSLLAPGEVKPGSVPEKA